MASWYSRLAVATAAKAAKARITAIDFAMVLQ